MARPTRRRATDPTEAPARSGRRALRWVGLLGGGTLAVGALAVFVFPTRTFLDQRAATSAAEERLAVLREENAAMADRLERLEDPEEVERLARDQYNLVRPGEEAYAVLPAPLPDLHLPTVWPFGPLQPAATPAP